MVGATLLEGGIATHLHFEFHSELGWLLLSCAGIKGLSQRSSADGCGPKIPWLQITV